MQIKWILLEWKILLALIRVFHLYSAFGTILVFKMFRLLIIFRPLFSPQLMEYSHLLDLADQCEDPYMRLVYTCKYIDYIYTFFTVNLWIQNSVIIRMVWFLFAASWAISVYYAYQRTWKPFNPILGETYEMVNHNGVTFIAEQVNCLEFFWTLFPLWLKYHV